MQQPLQTYKIGKKKYILSKKKEKGKTYITWCQHILNKIM
jgi:hypothetical protein